MLWVLGWFGEGVKRGVATGLLGELLEGCPLLAEVGTATAQEERPLWPQEGVGLLGFSLGQGLCSLENVLLWLPTFTPTLVPACARLRAPFPGNGQDWDHILVPSPLRPQDGSVWGGAG